MDELTEKPIGIAHLMVSIELLDSLLALPYGVRIKSVHMIDDSTIGMMVTGAGLPTLDETDGEIKQASMIVKQNYVPYIGYSALLMNNKVIKEQRWESSRLAAKLSGERNE